MMIGGMKTVTSAPTADQSTASFQDDHSICAHLMVLNLACDHYDMYLLHLS